jgi:glycosyltransferase 2 family protein
LTVPTAVRVIGWLAGAGVLAFLVVRLGSLWSEHSADVARGDAALLAAAVATIAVAVIAAGLVWVQTLRWLGIDASWGWIALYLRAQPAKYLPGGVWHYAGRVGLARVRGAPVGILSLSLAIELWAGAAVAGLVGLGALYPWAAAIMGVAGLLGALAVRRNADTVHELATYFVRSMLRGRGPSVAAVTNVVSVSVRVLLLFAPITVIHGLSLWLLGRALADASSTDLAYYVGAFAISWLVGLAAVFAPGGIGVREAVLTAFLSPRLGPADAILVAVASRMSFLAVDLVGGGASFLPGLLRRLAPQLTTERDPDAR